MSPHKREAKNHAKARRRRYRTAQERVAGDRRLAQQAAEALHKALEDLGLPENSVTEIAGRLRSQHRLPGENHRGVERKSIYVFELSDERQVKGHDLQQDCNWPW